MLIGLVFVGASLNQASKLATSPSSSASSSQRSPSVVEPESQLPPTATVVKRTVTELRSETAYSESEAVKAKELLETEEGVEIEIVEPQSTKELKLFLAKMDRKLAKRQSAGYEAWRSDVEELREEGGGLKDAAETLVQLAVEYRASGGENNQETAAIRNRLMQQIESTEKGKISIWGPREITEAEFLESQQKRKLSAFIGVLKEAGIDSTVIESVSIKGDTLTIVVSNLWHSLNYQVRYQAAQKLWEHWWKINRAKNADFSRIEIEDYSGNSVGGSRVWAGSLIWVQKN